MLGFSFFTPVVFSRRRGSRRVRVVWRRAFGGFGGGGGAVVACHCDEGAYLGDRTVFLRCVTPPGLK